LRRFDAKLADRLIKKEGGAIEGGTTREKEGSTLNKIVVVAYGAIQRAD